MKKIFGTIFCIAILSAHLVAMNTESNENLVQKIMQKPYLLKPYYNAIAQIRKTLDSCAKEFNYETGFVSWPTPNPFFCRTPKYLFLETSIIGQEENLVALYTPFGEVELLSGDSGGEMLTISKNFLTNMDWNIEDVTQQIKVYHYSQKEKRLVGPYSFKKEEWPGSCTQSKLYLIKSVGSIKLFNDSFDSKNENLVVWESVELAGGQYESDKLRFNTLSNGTDCF